MCHKLAESIIAWCESIYELDEYGHVKKVYGMEVFLESIWKLIGLLLIGNLAENRGQFFVSIICFSLLRIFAGGRHFKSSVVCFLFMMSVGLFPAIILKQANIPIVVNILIFCVIFMLIWVYAPSASYVTDRVMKRKVQATIIVMVYTAVFWLTSDLGIRNAMLFGTLTEAITLIKGRQRELWKKWIQIN